MYKRRLYSIGTCRIFWPSVIRNVQEEAVCNRYMQEFLPICGRKCTGGGSLHPGGKFGYFVKLHYLAKFRFVSVRSELRNLTLPGKPPKFRGRSAFFRVITKTVPRLFRRIFPERNLDDNPTSVPAWGDVRSSVILKDEEVVSARIDSRRSESGRLYLPAYTPEAEGGLFWPSLRSRASPCCPPIARWRSTAGHTSDERHVFLYSS
jgi:hypothetical protein